MPFPTVLKGFAQSLVLAFLSVELMSLYAGTPRFPGIYTMMMFGFSVVIFHRLARLARERDFR